MKLTLPTFKDKRELYKYLVENKQELFDLKKSATKQADPVSIGEGYIVKGLKSNHLPDDDIEGGVVYRSIIGNTYYWLDSHDDVHVKGIFTKTIKENEGRIRHTHDHVQQLTAKVGNFTSVYEKEVAWKDLDVNKAGSTVCLIADSAIKERFNKQIFDDYVNGEIDQHSVEMIYVKMALAINDKDEKEEYKNWQSVFPFLGNPEKALEQGYFFIQSESKLKAISCVIEGSNSLTGTIEPAKATLEPDEPKQRSIDYEKLMGLKFNNI